MELAKASRGEANAAMTQIKAKKWLAFVSDTFSISEIIMDG